MELKLVYRALRQISDWVLEGYYSEVVVEGAENVPNEGPLVIACTHANDLIDIATLSVTIPNRDSRFLCFWARSDIFKNPILGSILRSSGAIPVRRNPNKVDAKTDGDPIAARAALFAETTKVLNNGGVVGIFPEGGSSTSWRIFDVMPGAAWCGVEHARSASGKGLVIVPTSITYTDKTKFLSRVHVRYGKPITMDSYKKELLDSSTDANTAANAVVKKISGELKERLVEMTVNASDWDTICATNAARDILWTDDERIKLQDWVEVNQRLTSTLEASSAKQALTKYHSLLYHANIKHSVLETFWPTPSAPTLGQSIAPVIRSLPLATLRFVAFLPPFLLFLPGYILGPVLAKPLTTRREPEGYAQFKSLAAGLGIAANVTTLLSLLWRTSPDRLSLLKEFVFGRQQVVAEKPTWVRWVHAAGATYMVIWVLVKWHNLLVKGNDKELQKVRTAWKLVKSAVSRRTLDTERIEIYTKPLYPAISPWLRQKVAAKGAGSSSSEDGITGQVPLDFKPQPVIDGSKLVPAIFEARKEAKRALWEYLGQEGNSELRTFLAQKGALVQKRDV